MQQIHHSMVGRIVFIKKKDLLNEFFIDLETKLSPRQTSALGGAPITGTKLPSKRKLAVNEVGLLLIDEFNKLLFFSSFRLFEMIQTMIT